jgi:hypothetical protein
MVEQYKEADRNVRPFGSDVAVAGPGGVDRRAIPEKRVVRDEPDRNVRPFGSDMAPGKIDRRAIPDGAVRDEPDRSVRPFGSDRAATPGDRVDRKASP